MLVDQLGMTIAAQQHGKIVEPGDDSLELDAVDQEDGHRVLSLADSVQKYVLEIL